MSYESACLIVGMTSYYLDVAFLAIIHSLYYESKAISLIRLLVTL